MRKDQIFVLMLVILLPMSGCFDGAVGDAEANDDMTDSTSNNESNGMFSVSGMVDENTPTGCDEGLPYCYFAYTFTTNSSELIEVISLYVGGAHTGHSISTDCGNGFEAWVSESYLYDGHNFLPFSDLDCEHTVEISFTYSDGEPRTPSPYFSLVYKIHEVSVVTE